MKSKAIIGIKSIVLCIMYVVMYFKTSANPAEIQHKSFCFLSHDMDHDTYVIFLMGVVGNSKYFFSNLCHHQTDFQFNAEWVLFATSHGKSPCDDGIGGTVKRTMARASLQRPLNQQILTVDAMLQFCIENIDSIIFYKIIKETMTITRRQLKERFEKGKTVPGTWSYHHYKPIS